MESLSVMLPNTNSHQTWSWHSICYRQTVNTRLKRFLATTLKWVLKLEAVTDLKIVRQFLSPGVARVHRDEDGAGWIKHEFSAFKYELFHALSDCRLNAVDLLSDDRQHFQFNAVELIETRPRTGLRETFEELAHRLVVEPVGTVEHYALTTNSQPTQKHYLLSNSTTRTPATDTLYNTTNGHHQRTSSKQAVDVVQHVTNSTTWTCEQPRVDNDRGGRTSDTDLLGDGLCQVFTRLCLACTCRSFWSTAKVQLQCSHQSAAQTVSHCHISSITVASFVTADTKKNVLPT